MLELELELGELFKERREQNWDKVLQRWRFCVSSSERELRF